MATMSSVIDASISSFSASMWTVLVAAGEAESGGEAPPGLGALLCRAGRICQVDLRGSVDSAAG